MQPFQVFENWPQPWNKLRSICSWNVLNFAKNVGSPWHFKMRMLQSTNTTSLRYGSSSRVCLNWESWYYLHQSIEFSCSCVLSQTIAKSFWRNLKKWTVLGLVVHTCKPSYSEDRIKRTMVWGMTAYPENEKQKCWGLWPKWYSACLARSWL
jgi:hypothetical protein